MIRTILMSSSVVVMLLSSAAIARADHHLYQSQPQPQSQPQSQPQPQQAVVQPLSTNQTTPFDLIHLAQNGFLVDQGIPSHGRLESAFASGQVTAESLIRAAIAAHRLPPEILNDARYISNVATLLEDMDDD